MPYFDIGRAGWRWKTVDRLEAGGESNTAVRTPVRRVDPVWRSGAAIWRQAFRPFFLGGSLFSILCLFLWICALNGWMVISPYANILFWHGHEMLFGFVAAILAGFLLTAVQNWTQLRATNGRALLALFALWLTGRVLMFSSVAKFEWVVAAVDLAFLPAVALLAARLIIKAKNYRNLLFVPVLLLLTFTNLLTHLSFLLDRPAWLSWGLNAAVMLVSLLMILVGGRVIPMFSANGTATKAVAALVWLEKLCLFSAGLIGLVFVAGIQDSLPPVLMVALFAISALANTIRAGRWFIPKIFNNPLVWCLHTAYWFIPLGMALFALHYAGFPVSSTVALHALTAGAMGSLIMAMISRVSLGHSGRPLSVRPVMQLAFLLIWLSGMTRLLVGIFAGAQIVAGYSLAALMWILAYGLFVVNYASILTSPRPDGKPG